MVVSAQASRVLKVRFKSYSNKGHFTHQAETFYRRYLPWHCKGVTEICDIALLAHALEAVRVRPKSVSNEGHFTLDAATVSRPYLPSHCSCVIET
jgi:hypothetical protein